MKTKILKNYALSLSLILTASINTAFAKNVGGDSGGGGDALEGRVNEIRSDLLNWIITGGAKELIFPADISYGEYANKMADILENKKVPLSFTYEAVKVKGVEKTCRGSFVTTKTLFFEKKTNPHILCNISRFKDTAEPEQYSLIHHEYAGLVNIEKNDGSASDYEISNQLTDFLEDKIVKKLAVKKKPVPKVEIKRDPTLERKYLKKVSTFNIEETLTECRPLHDQMKKEQLQKFEGRIFPYIDQTIKDYYKQNGLIPVVDTKVVSKNTTKSASGDTTEITYVFVVNAGKDSTKMKFTMSIDGLFQARFGESIINYVDKLGRIKARELNCALKNDFKVDYFESSPFSNAERYKAAEPKINTRLINLESGYQIDPNNELDYHYYYMIYESETSVKKEL